MNNFQIIDVLKDYPVRVCSADQVRYVKGQFIIANTQTSDQTGEHWICFYFPEEGPDEFFDSLGKAPEYYDVKFETKLNNEYYRTVDQIQDSTSDLCGLYCIYYVVCRHAGVSMQTLLNVFDINHKKNNDETLVGFLCNTKETNLV